MPNPPVAGMDGVIKKAGEAGLGVIAMKALAGGAFLDRERTRPMNTIVAIKWVLLNQNAHTVIPGMINFEQLDLNINILGNITLSDEERKEISLAHTENKLDCTFYQNCISGCKLIPPIPDLMRAYMYTYGYTNSLLAKNMLTELKIPENPCYNCNICSVKCTRNFNIREKIYDISRLHWQIKKSNTQVRYIYCYG